MENTWKAYFLTALIGISSVFLGMSSQPDRVTLPVQGDAVSSSSKGESSSFQVSSRLPDSSMEVSSKESPSSQEVSSQTSSSKPQVVAKPVVMTKDEIKEAAKETATEEEKREEDPQYNRPTRPSPPIEDTVPEPSSSQASSAVPSSQPPVTSAPSSSDTTASVETSSIPDVSSGTSTESGAVSGSSDIGSSQPPSSVGSSSVPPSSLGPQTGWYVLNGKKYYNVNHTPVTGWQTIEGRKYKFDDRSGQLLSRIGIDVSEYQKSIDWKAVKADGVDFVILRVGFRGWGSGTMWRDAKFDEHYAGAKAAGLQVGVYFFSQSINEQEAIDEASFVLEAIKGKNIDGPIAYDIEGASDPNARTNDPSITNQTRTDMCIAFCDTIKAAGYVPQVCTYLGYAYYNLYMTQLTAYQTWIAHYGVAGVTSYKYPFKMWQFTSTGKVNGISGNVDIDVML